MFASKVFVLPEQYTAPSDPLHAAWSRLSASPPALLTSIFVHAWPFEPLPARHGLSFVTRNVRSDPRVRRLDAVLWRHLLFSPRAQRTVLWWSADATALVQMSTAWPRSADSSAALQFADSFVHYDFCVDPSTAETSVRQRLEAQGARLGVELLWARRQLMAPGQRCATLGSTALLTVGLACLAFGGACVLATQDSIYLLWLLLGSTHVTIGATGLRYGLRERSTDLRAGLARSLYAQSMLDALPTHRLQRGDGNTALAPDVQAP